MTNQDNQKPRYSTLHYGVREQLDISWAQYVLLDMIYHLSAKFGFCSKSVRAIAADLGDTKTSVHRHIKELLDRELLIKLEGGYKCSDAYISIAYLETVPSRDTRPKVGQAKRPKMKPSVPKRDQVSQNVSNNRGENNNRITVDNNTDVLEPTAPERYGKVQINEVFDFWAQEVGFNIESKVKANRFAAHNMLKKYGPEKLTQLIKGVALTQTDQYAPRIADFCDLQAKTTQLIAWGQRKHGASSIGVVR